MDKKRVAWNKGLRRHTWYISCQRKYFDEYADEFVWYTYDWDKHYTFMTKEEYKKEFPYDPK